MYCVNWQYSWLQRTATLQHTATHCNTLQHTHHYNTSRRYLTLWVFWVDILKSPVTIKCTVWIGFKADCNALQHTATHCNTLQHTAAHCSTSRRNSTSRGFWVHILKSPVTIEYAIWIGYKADCNTLQHTATHCNTLQHTATHCNTLQHTATHYWICDINWL